MSLCKGQSVATHSDPLGWFARPLHPDWGSQQVSRPLQVGCSNVNTVRPTGQVLGCRVEVTSVPMGWAPRVTELRAPGWIL